MLSSSLRHTSPATHGEGKDYSAFFKSQTHLTCYTWRRTRLQCSLQVLDTPHLLHMEQDKIIVLSSSLRHTSLATHGEGQDYSALFKSQAHLTCYTWRRKRLQCFLQVLDTPHLLHMEKEKITMLSSSLTHTSLATHGEGKGQDYSVLFKSQTHVICYTWRRTRLHCSLQVLGTPHLLHMEKEKITMLSSILKYTSFVTHGEGQDYSALFNSQTHLICYTWRTRLQCSLQVFDPPHLLHMEKDMITVLSSSLRHTSPATHGAGQHYSALFKSQTHVICYTWRRTRLRCFRQVLETPHLLHMEQEKITVLSSNVRHTSPATHGAGQDYNALFQSQTHLTCYPWRRKRLQYSLQVLDTPHLLHMEKDMITVLSSSLRHTSLATHGEGQDYSALFKSYTPHLLPMEKEKITVLSSSLRHTSPATHGEGKDYSTLFKSQTHLIY